MECDSCGNSILDGTEKSILLMGLLVSFRFNLCANCDDALPEPGQVDILGRDPRMRKVQELARRMPERGENTQAMLDRSRGTFGPVRFDEGLHP